MSIHGNSVAMSPPWQVTVTTSSTPQTFALQTDSASALVIDWGDGSFNSYTGTGTRSHSYAAPGTYTITFMSGKATRIAFGPAGTNTPTLLKSIKTPIPKWLGLTSALRMFQDCTGINGTTGFCANWFDEASGQMTNLSFLFCGMLYNSPVNTWDTSKVTDFSYMFYNNTSFNQPVSNWNTGKSIDMSWMFTSAEKFDQEINMWDVSKVTSMLRMLEWAKVFNRSLTGWNTASLNTLFVFAYEAFKFNQSLAGLNVAAVTTFELGLTSTKFNQSNYDPTLISWAAQNVRNNVVAHFGSAKYGTTAAASRAVLVGKGWTITDGGPA